MGDIHDVDVIIGVNVITTSMYVDNVNGIERTNFGVYLEYQDSTGDIHDVDVLIVVDVVTADILISVSRNTYKKK